MLRPAPPPTLESVRQTLASARDVLEKQRALEAKIRSLMALDSLKFGAYVNDDLRAANAAAASQAGPIRIGDLRDRIAALVDLVAGLELLESEVEHVGD